jgi:sec-independent protein translocase protein TatC
MEDQGSKPLTEHLTELRHRLLWVLLVFVLSLMLGVVFTPSIFAWLRHDSLQGVKLYAFNPADALKLYMQISLLTGWTLTLPTLLYHLWKFIKPGLHPHEQKAAITYIPVIILLFAGGICFGYFYIFPLLIQFLVSLNDQIGIIPQYNVYQYFSFMFGIIFPLALFFELPILFLFLTRLRLVTPQWLSKMRRFAYLALVIVGAIITPPDFISNILVTVPLLLLYEIGVLLSTWLYRRMEKEEEGEL